MVVNIKPACVNIKPATLCILILTRPSKKKITIFFTLCWKQSRQDCIDLANERWTTIIAANIFNIIYLISLFARWSSVEAEFLNSNNWWVSYEVQSVVSRDVTTILCFYSMSFPCQRSNETEITHGITVARHTYCSERNSRSEWDGWNLKCAWKEVRLATLSTGFPLKSCGEFNSFEKETAEFRPRLLTRGIPLPTESELPNLTHGKLKPRLVFLKSFSSAGK